MQKKQIKQPSQKIYANTGKTDLTKSFFSQARKPSRPDYLSEVSQKNVGVQLGDIEQKIHQINVHQRKLNTLNKDTSIYSSNDDEISQLIIRIQDQMKEVQAEKEDKETLAKQKRCQE